VDHRGVRAAGGDRGSHRVSLAVSRSFTAGHSSSRML
jgi:hypothetical protein